MPRKRKTDTSKKQYFLRMFSSGVWYFLLRCTHDKKSHCMKPVWWPEKMQGVSRPYIFKTLIGARNAQDNYVPSGTGARSEIKEWSDAHGQLENQSA